MNGMLGRPSIGGRAQRRMVRAMPGETAETNRRVGAGPFRVRRRSRLQKLFDFVTFPVRAVRLFDDDRWGLSSLRTERFDYVAREVQGRCLDVGCGRHNTFVREFLGGNGVGIDVFRYEGLAEEQIVTDISHFPFEDATFDSVTFIACLNHVPRSLRDVELAEAHRCLRSGGNLIVTMGHPVAEILVHKLIWVYDRLFATNYDADSERGMDPEEAYYLSTGEITERLERAGFSGVRRKLFATQWGLNGLFVGWKK